MINLYDNFLSKEDFSYIKENILDNRYFPWYHNDYKVTPEDNIVQFTHMFYEKHNKNSEHYKFLEQSYCSCFRHTEDVAVKLLLLENLFLDFYNI